jgi:hypothetical protein
VSLVPSPRGLVPWAPYSMFFANFASQAGSQGSGGGGRGGATRNETQEEEEEEEEGPINYSTSGKNSPSGLYGTEDSEMSSIRRRMMIGGSGGSLLGFRDSLGNRVSLSCDEDEDSGENIKLIKDGLDLIIFLPFICLHRMLFYL